MQKKIIALAVAGLMSGAAFAQSNVTVYGTMDIGYADVHSSGIRSDRVNGIGGGTNSANGSGQLSGSRIGFKGVEDLGNGNKALFTIEYGVNLTQGEFDDASGANTTGAVTGQGLGNLRQGIVGLTGNWGTMIMGTTYSPIEKASGFAAGNNAYGGTNLTSGADALMKYGQNARGANIIAYVTPTFSGFRAVGGYQWSKNVRDNSNAATFADASDDKTNASWVLGMDYNNGPIKAGYSYQKIKTAYLGSSSAAAGNIALVNLVGSENDVNIAQAINVVDKADLTYHVFGGTYDFGVAKVGLNHARYKIAVSSDSETAALAGNDVKSKQTSLSVNVPVTAAFSIGGGYAWGEIDSNTALGSLFDTKGWDIVAVYNLSKRTNVYGVYSQSKFDSNTAANTVLSTSNNDVKQSQWGVGLRHSF
jgi:predicted porin